MKLSPAPLSISALPLKVKSMTKMKFIVTVLAVLMVCTDSAADNGRFLDCYLDILDPVSNGTAGFFLEVPWEPASAPIPKLAGLTTAGPMDGNFLLPLSSPDVSL